VALTRRSAADRARRLEDVHAMTRAVAQVRPVARAAVRRPGARRRARLEAIRGACARRSRAVLRDVALTRRRAADRGRGLERIDTRIRRAAAMVRRIARAAV